MELYNIIKELVEGTEGLSEGGGYDVCLDMAAQCEEQLEQWYAAHDEPDYRLLKLLRNLVFYLKTPDCEITYRCEMIPAIAKTLLRTADYDINIRPYPDKVRQRNEGILRLCDELRDEEKEPLEETSGKPYDMTIYMATYNQLELTKLCLGSIYRNTNDVSYEIFLIDNGSSDGTYEYFKDDSRVKLIRLNENTGLLPALHIFYESGLDNGKFWMYMNNDVIVTPRWASNMLKCIKSDPKIGSVLPVTNRSASFACIQPPLGLYDIDDIQDFGERYNRSNPNMWQDWLMYYGFVLLARPSVRRKFGYHEDCFYFPFYYSDGDIILSQVKAGYRAVQARDTYIHHFDGGHTVLQDRRSALAAGEKMFFDKYGFFPTDIERSLPAAAVTGAVSVAANASVNVAANASYYGTGAGAKVLFLDTSRFHPLLQLQSLNKILDNRNVKYYSADIIDMQSIKQLTPDVQHRKLDNWYELETIFPGEFFDAVFYPEDIMKLRNPVKFLSAVYNRLAVNGKLYFIAENNGRLLTLNYILMSKRKSPRDAARINKKSIVSIERLIRLILDSGFTIESIEDILYNENFTYANLDTVEKYRILCNNEVIGFERNIRVQTRNIVARKPGNVDTENTLEQILFAKKGGADA